MKVDRFLLIDMGGTTEGRERVRMFLRRLAGLPEVGPVDLAKYKTALHSVADSVTYQQLANWYAGSPEHTLDLARFLNQSVRLLPPEYAVATRKYIWQQLAMSVIMVVIPDYIDPVLLASRSGFMREMLADYQKYLSPTLGRVVHALLNSASQSPVFITPLGFGESSLIDPATPLIHRQWDQIIRGALGLFATINLELEIIKGVRAR